MDCKFYKGSIVDGAFVKEPKAVLPKQPRIKESAERRQLRSILSQERDALRRISFNKARTIAALNKPEGIEVEFLCPVDTHINDAAHELYMDIVMPKYAEKIAERLAAFQAIRAVNLVNKVARCAEQMTVDKVVSDALPEMDLEVEALEVVISTPSKKNKKRAATDVKEVAVTVEKAKKSKKAKKAKKTKTVA